MTCACVENEEGTAILRPCQLHATWAKTHAAQTWGDAPHRVRERPAKPLDAYGPEVGGRGKSTTR